MRYITTLTESLSDEYLPDWKSGREEYELDLAHEKSLGDTCSLIDFDGAMKAALDAAADIYQDKPNGMKRSHCFIAGWMSQWYLCTSIGETTVTSH